MKHVFVTALAFGASLAHADAILEYSGNGAVCHADFERLALQGAAMRIDQAPPQQDFSFVYDGVEKTGVALDRTRKQFFEMEFDDDALDFQGDVMKSTSTMVEKKMEKFQQQAQEMSGGRAQFGAGANGMPQIDPKAMEAMTRQSEALMQQSMAHMNKEQRAQMEQALKNMREYYGAAAQSEPVTEATGEQRDINGVACIVERTTQDGTLLHEDCRASVTAIGLDGADLKHLQRALLRLFKFADTVRSNLHIAGVRMERERPDLEHLLVERRCFAQGAPAGSVQLHVRHDAAPADWFERPSDYARMEMGAGMR